MTRIVHHGQPVVISIDLLWGEEDETNRALENSIVERFSHFLKTNDVTILYVDYIADEDPDEAPDELITDMLYRVTKLSSVLTLSLNLFLDKSEGGYVGDTTLTSSRYSELSTDKPVTEEIFEITTELPDMGWDKIVDYVIGWIMSCYPRVNT